MPQIMKARRRPIDQVSLEDLGVTVEPRCEIVAMEVPSTDRSCTFFDTAEQLLRALRSLEGELHAASADAAAVW